MTSDRLLSLVDRFASCRVVVAGDLVADEFLSGQPARVSREAPVLILRYQDTRVVPGGGGNAANNVAALGARVQLFGLAGRDEAGRRLLACFPRGVDTKGVVRPAGYRTPTKTRVLAGGIHSAKQQIVRIDREPVHAPPGDVAERVAEALLGALDGADAVLLSDYGYGLVTPALAGAVSARLSGRAGASGPPSSSTRATTWARTAALRPARRTSPRSSSCWGRRSGTMGRRWSGRGGRCCGGCGCRPPW